MKRSRVPVSYRAVADRGIVSDMGEALETINAALAIGREGRFQDLGKLLADDIDWQGLVDDEGVVPHCRGRDTALRWMGQGLFARGLAEVSSVEEHGPYAIVAVRPTTSGTDVRDRWVLVEVRDRKIAAMAAFPDLDSARAACNAAA